MQFTRTYCRRILHFVKISSSSLVKIVFGQLSKDLDRGLTEKYDIYMEEEDKQKREAVICTKWRENFICITFHFLIFLRLKKNYGNI